RAEAPDRPGAGVPAAVQVLAQAEELVEAAGVAIDDQRVVVAAALDLDVVGDRVGAGVALVAVAERHGDGGLRAGDDRDRNPDRLAVPLARSEVGVEALVESDRRDDL